MLLLAGISAAQMSKTEIYSRNIQYSRSLIMCSGASRERLYPPSLSDTVNWGDLCNPHNLSSYNLPAWFLAAPKSK